MGTLAKTEIVDFRLLFADQENKLLQQTHGSCHFRFPSAANKWKLLFSVSSVFHIYVYIRKTGLNICSHFKQKSEAR
jgi:hypothetical protein